MRLKVSRSKNSASLYVTKTVYEGKKERTVTVEKLGTEIELREKLNGADPYLWAREYIQELNRLEKENSLDVVVKYSPVKQIQAGVRTSYNGGYLFLQQLYYKLGIHKICKEISGRYKFSFDLNEILSCLIYGRILFPASKKSTYEKAASLIEAPTFDMPQIYRALEVISKESDHILSALYKNSAQIYERNTNILFYDCTNFFFEIEQEDDFRKYGQEKNHRPCPIVQMGLFIDGDGIPLSFTLTPGNQNEQTTLKPLEETILSDFDLSKFVVCTDAGLSSTANRKFNNHGERAFVTTQSIKKLKGHLKEWALDPHGWHVTDDLKTYDISFLTNASQELSEAQRDHYKKITYYKERWLNEDDLEQKLIVTYSLKYSDYQKQIRSKQLERAAKLMEEPPSSLKKKHPNDPKRFIKQNVCTKDGEKAEHEFYEIDLKVIQEEAQYDGFYAVCTNLESRPVEVIKINKGRWEIEECFRIMKTSFESRPVYLSRKDRIRAHFTTCFMALMIYRILEKELKEAFTCDEIVDGLRSMNFHKIPNEGYVPNYIRNDFTDKLHEIFGFRTDYQIITNKTMKKILKKTKT